MVLLITVKKLLSLLLILFITSLIYIVFTYDSKHWNHLDETNDSKLIDKILNRVYISSMIYSTVGLGHISPSTYMCRAIVNIHLLFVIVSIHYIINN